MGREERRMTKVEFIESYIKVGNDYQWHDNHGELIRCKDCKHRDPEDKKCDCGHDIIWQLPRHDDWYCADAERKEE